MSSGVRSLSSWCICKSFYICMQSVEGKVLNLHVWNNDFIITESTRLTVVHHFRSCYNHVLQPRLAILSHLPLACSKSSFDCSLHSCFNCIIYEFTYMCVCVCMHVCVCTYTCIGANGRLSSDISIEQ